MTELNEPQSAAVLHARGPLLIFAGAGSGKTRTITFRIANLLAQHRVPPYRILAVTFTNKAAAEMRSRLVQLAGAEVVRDLWVGTFHSICARLLRRYHEEVGLTQRFVIYDESDQKAVITRALKEAGLDERRYPPRFVLSKILAEKREGREPKDLEGRKFDPALVEMYERYQRAMRLCDAVDFEDLIVLGMRVAESVDSRGGQDLRARFMHVLVDEFQDTNLTQYRFVRALSARSRNLCVVGDDDQSIYSWRGADVRLIRGFRDDFPDATVIKLEQNYRSTGNIVSAALGVIEPSREREPKRLWTAEAAGEPVRVRALLDERDEADFVVRSLRAEVAQGVSLRDVAIFYRVHAQSRVLEEALRSENVPYQIIGGMRFFERAEVKDLVAYLRLIDNPRSDADLIRIINTPARGIGNKTVERLLDTAAERTCSAYDALLPAAEYGDLGSAARKKLLAFRSFIEKMREAAQHASPHEIAVRVLDESGYHAMLQADDSAESDARLGNLEELVGSIEEFEADCHEAGQTPTLSAYLERVTLVSAVDGMGDNAAVSLMTVHSAKGLEFNTVFLTGMEEEIFPYKSVESNSMREIEEERRLAYVAVTRARKRLFITHVGSRTLFGKTRYLAPSRFLLDLPEHSVERRNLGGASGYRQGYAHTEAAPALPPRPRPPLPSAPPPGERVVDREAFDDVPRQRVNRPMREGDRVYHRRFGQGTVEEVDAGSPSVAVRFPGFGIRRIMTQYLEIG